MTLKIESPVFEEGQMIPAKYTCDGSDVSPPLEWSDPPGGTRSFAVIADDPDAPVGTWVHWVVYNIPPTVREFEENVPAMPQLEDGTIQGKTDFGRIGYGGPCPPSGTHRYYFKLYALDATLSLESGATKKQVEAAMEGHVLAEGRLMGTYKRQ